MADGAVDRRVLLRAPRPPEGRRAVSLASDPRPRASPARWPAGRLGRHDDGRARSARPAGTAEGPDGGAPAPDPQPAGPDAVDRHPDPAPQALARDVRTRIRQPSRRAQ